MSTASWLEGMPACLNAYCTYRSSSAPMFPDKAGGLEMSGAATSMQVARNRETSSVPVAEKLHCAR